MINRSNLGARVFNDGEKNYYILDEGIDELIEIKTGELTRKAGILHALDDEDRKYNLYYYDVYLEGEELEDQVVWYYPDKIEEVTKFI